MICFLQAEDVFPLEIYASHVHNDGSGILAAPRTLCCLGAKSSPGSAKPPGIFQPRWPVLMAVLMADVSPWMPGDCPRTAVRERYALAPEGPRPSASRVVVT